MLARAVARLDEVVVPFAGWTVTNCTSFRLLRGGFFMEIAAAVNCLRSSGGIHRILVRRTATTHAVVGANCCMVRQMQRCRQKLYTVPPGSAEEEHAGFKSSIGEGTECRKRQRNVRRQAGSRRLLRSVSARPNPRQQCWLTRKNLLAGWPPSKSVELLSFQHRAVRALRCWGFLLLRESQAAQRYTRLARCMEPVQASVASLSLSSQLAVPSKKRYASSPTFQPCEVLAKLAAVLDKPGNSRSLEEEFGVNPGRPSTETEYTEVLNGGGSGGRGLQRLGGHAAAHFTHPSRMPWSCHCGARDVREDLMTLPGESWSWQRHAKERPPSPLWSLPNFTKGRRDGCRSPHRGQNRRVRTLACDVVSARRSPQLVPVTLSGGVGPRCQPAHAVVRAVTATKHEPGLSPSYRVVSYGSAMEVWPSVRAARYLLWCRFCEAAWTRRLSVVTSDEAAAKHFFSLCSTGNPFQIQNLSVFCATWRIGLPVKPLPSGQQKMLSPLASVPPLVLQLYRYLTLGRAPQRSNCGTGQSPEVCVENSYWKSGPECSVEEVSCNGWRWLPPKFVGKNRFGRASGLLGSDG